MTVGIWIVLAFYVIGQSFCFYMLYRNERVAQFRRSILGSSTYEHETRTLHPYSDMPEYGEMMRKFWVWPLSKFLPKPQGKGGA